MYKEKRKKEITREEVPAVAKVGVVGPVAAGGMVASSSFWRLSCS